MYVIPTDAQAAALALPGEGWEAARRRAKRLLNAVRECRPCPLCAPGGPHDFADRHHGWAEDDQPECVPCSMFIIAMADVDAELYGADVDEPTN